MELQRKKTLFLDSSDGIEIEIEIEIDRFRVGG